MSRDETSQSDRCIPGTVATVDAADCVDRRLMGVLVQQHLPPPSLAGGPTGGLVAGDAVRLLRCAWEGITTLTQSAALLQAIVSAVCAIRRFVLVKLLSIVEGVVQVVRQFKLVAALVCLGLLVSLVAVGDAGRTSGRTSGRTAALAGPPGAAVRPGAVRLERGALLAWAGRQR